MKGLRFQWAVFYVLLSLPALLLIERAVFGWKFENLLRQLDDGRVERLLAQEAAAFERDLGEGARREELHLRLQHLVLRLERPRESLGTSAAFVLLELTPHPFEARLRWPEGTALAAATPRRPQRHWLRRSWSQPLVTPTGAVAQLELELAVPSPWRPSLEAVSFEWRLAVAYLLVFLLASAGFLRWRVLQRVSRMADAARAWAGGDFSVSLRDRSADELGQLAQALDRMAEDVQALVGTRARLASLEERQRLGRELHDTVKQKAFALSLQLAAARDSADAAAREQRLADAQGLIAEIQRELAQLLQDMRAPGPLATAQAPLDLIPPLSQRLDDFARRSGLACQRSLPPSLRLPADAADALLRVLDEALANVWRHAQARAVKVALQVSDAPAVEPVIEARQRGGAADTVAAPLVIPAGEERAPAGADADARAGGARRVLWVLSVEDDGRGIDAGAGPGMGLENMRARAQSLGGCLQLYAARGQGTRLTLSFPRPAAPDDAGAPPC